MYDNLNRVLTLQLRDLRGGTSGTSEADLTLAIQEYQGSAFYYDKAHAFLEQRKRVINTITLIMEEAAKSTAPGGGKVFTVASAQSSEDNNCILDSRCAPCIMCFFFEVFF